MGNSIKNLVFGGGSKPKKSAASKLVFGDKAKPPKSKFSSLVFGSKKKTERTGASALVFGDSKKPQRTGWAALAFGTGKSTKYEPDDYVSAQSMRPKRRLSRGDYIEGKSLHKRVRDYNRKHAVSAKVRVEGEKNFKNIKIKDGKLGDIMKSVVKEERFVGRTESSAANKIANKRIKYRDKEGNLTEIKLDRATRRKLAKMATVRDFEKPSEEIPQEVKAARIAASRATAGIASERSGDRSDPRARLSKNKGRASDIGAKTVEEVSKKTGFAQLSKSDKTSAGSDKQHGTASIEQSKEASGVTSGMGANKEVGTNDSKVDAEPKSKSSGQPVVISGGAGMSEASHHDDAKAQEERVNSSDDEFFYSARKDMASNRNKVDFAKLVEERKAMDKESIKN
ncbi:MAG: hypothetical protein U9Q85_02825 [Patescibacteria group bacterium]|nr:hypothetical protein [Patescibacteria group bacterium]